MKFLKLVCSDNNYFECRVMSKCYRGPNFLDYHDSHAGTRLLIFFQTGLLNKRRRFNFDLGRMRQTCSFGNIILNTEIFVEIECFFTFWDYQDSDASIKNKKNKRNQCLPIAMIV